MQIDGCWFDPPDGVGLLGTIDLKLPFQLLIGKNASGKTLLLRRLARLFDAHVKPSSDIHRAQSGLLATGRIIDKFAYQHAEIRMDEPNDTEPEDASDGFFLAFDTASQWDFQQLATWLPERQRIMVDGSPFLMYQSSDDPLLWWGRLADHLAKPYYRSAAHYEAEQFAARLVERAVIAMPSSAHAPISLYVQAGRSDTETRRLAAFVSHKAIEVDGDLARMAAAVLSSSGVESDDARSYEFFTDLGFTQDTPHCNIGPMPPQFLLQAIPASVGSLDVLAHRCVTLLIATCILRDTGVGLSYLVQDDASLDLDNEWVSLRDDGSAVPTPGLLTMIEVLAGQARQYLPRFVRAQGDLVLSVPPLDEWFSNAPRVSVGLRERDGEFNERGISSGIRRWVAASLLLATRSIVIAYMQLHPEERKEQWWEAWDSGDLTALGLDGIEDTGSTAQLGAPPQGILLVDEPELHLHTLAQQELVEWIIERTRENLVVVAATHSADMLRPFGDRAADAVHALTRQGSYFAIEELSSSVLRSLRTRWRDYGFATNSWVNALAGVLVLEGEHDLAIVEHFFGRELQEAHVLPLALRGTKNARALIHSDFFGLTGVPLLVVWDNTRARVLESMESIEGISDEERELVQLLHQVGAGQDVRAFGYPDPDIICALPISTIHRTYPKSVGVDWRDIVKDWRDLPERKNFKPYARKRLGIAGVSDAEFIRTVLNNRRDDEMASPELRAAVMAALNSLRARLAGGK